MCSSYSMLPTAKIRICRYVLRVMEDWCTHKRESYWVHNLLRNMYFSIQQVLCSWCQIIASWNEAVCVTTSIQKEGACSCLPAGEGRSPSRLGLSAMGSKYLYGCRCGDRRMPVRRRRVLAHMGTGDGGIGIRDSSIQHFQIVSHGPSFLFRARSGDGIWVSSSTPTRYPASPT